MSNLTVTVELSREDRDRLDTIITLLAQTPDRTPVEALREPEAVTHENVQAEVETFPVVENTEPVEASEPVEPTYTKDDIVAKVQSLAQPGNPKREQVKAIVKEYAAKVSDIPSDKYEEVMERLTALEG